MNRLFIILVVFQTACSSVKSSRVSETTKNDIKEVLQSEKIDLKVDTNRFVIRPTNSLLNSMLSMELAASLASLLIYEDLYANNTELNFNTSFDIKFSDTVHFEYKLAQVSQALSRVKSSNNLLDSLSSKGEIETFFVNKGGDRSTISWENQMKYDLVGFQFTNIEFYSENKEALLIRYVAQRENKEFWIYYSLESNLAYVIISPDQL